tara:strand:- start:41 stop:610 length:570 start_codon:yes stop_codon:yes gene_type:complete
VQYVRKKNLVTSKSERGDNLENEERREKVEEKEMMKDCGNEEERGSVAEAACVLDNSTVVGEGEIWNRKCMTDLPLRRRRRGNSAHESSDKYVDGAGIISSVAKDKEKKKMDCAELVVNNELSKPSNIGMKKDRLRREIGMLDTSQRKQGKRSVMNRFFKSKHVGRWNKDGSLSIMGRLDRYGNIIFYI